MENAAHFLTAVTSGDEPTVQRMLAEKPTLARARNEQGVPALLVALYNQKPAIAERLLAHAAPLDIWEASAMGQKMRVRELIATDPGLINAYAADGFTPLELAIFFGRREIVDVLLSAGADVDQPARNAMKVRPLHAAAAAQQLEIVRLLLERGADPNAPQQQGYRPLHQASLHGLEEMARVLLKHGADVNVRSDDGTSALGFALKGKHDATARLLREQGGIE